MTRLWSLLYKFDKIIARDDSSGVSNINCTNTHDDINWNQTHDESSGVFNINWTAMTPMESLNLNWNCTCDDSYGVSYINWKNPTRDNSCMICCGLLSKKFDSELELRLKLISSQIKKNLYLIKNRVVCLMRWIFSFLEWVKNLRFLSKQKTTKSLIL